MWVPPVRVQVLPVLPVPQVWEQALRVQVQAQASAEKATEKALPVPERGLVRVQAQALREPEQVRVQEKKYPLPK